MEMKMEQCFLLPTNIQNTSIVAQTKKGRKKILYISRSNLTKLILIITGFNCLSYMQFKANPKINSLCRLCGEDKETFCHRMWQNDQDSEHIEKRFFRQNPPKRQLETKFMSFSMYCTVYNLLSYRQEYYVQPIHKLDWQYSKHSKSDNTIIQNLYRSYL